MKKKKSEGKQKLEGRSQESGARSQEPGSRLERRGPKVAATSSGLRPPSPPRAEKGAPEGDLTPALSPVRGGRASSGEGGRAAGGVKRPPLERMDRIYAWLRAEEYPNCSRITAEFGVDRKTALRDIEFMRDRKGLPIGYHDQRHGYYFDGPVPKVAAMEVTDKEMFELYVMHQAIEHYRGTPLEQRLERFFRRMAGQLDNEERFTLEDLGSVLSFRPSAPDEADAKLFELVTRAVRERRWLQFDYRKPGAREAEGRRVQPYHVLEYGGRWYLLAYDRMRRDVRTFVLGRMREALMLEERFERPRDFDPRRHLEKGIGVMAGSGDFEVVIKMDAWLTDILRGRRWHPSQVVEELPGGGSRLRLRLGCLEEIEQYVLSWGTHATIIGPQRLRERVGKAARELAARYADAGMGNPNTEGRSSKCGAMS